MGAKRAESDSSYICHNLERITLSEAFSLDTDAALLEDAPPKMNPHKQRILTVAADLLLGNEPCPKSGNLSNVTSLEQCIAFVLQTREGLKPLHAVGCRLKNEERDIFPEVVWDLFCARVIIPAIQGDGLDKIRPHSDAAANWERFKTTIGISG